MLISAHANRHRKDGQNGRQKGNLQLHLLRKTAARDSKDREKYLPREESKLDVLRRLDKNASRKGTVVSIILGVIGCLVMGVGMCCAMVWMGDLFIPGIVIGLAGIALVGAAYPVYTHITQKEREKIAPEILRITDELSEK